MNKAINIIIKEIKTTVAQGKTYAPATKQSLDLLIYLNPGKTSIKESPIDKTLIKETLDNEMWRSISFVTNNASGVIHAKNDAPNLLKNKLYTIAYKSHAN